MLKTFEEYKGFKDKITYLEEILKNHKCEKVNGKWSNFSNKVDLELKSDFVENGRLLVQFGKTGSFRCSDIGLTTLEGCPDEVYGSFSCSFNNIENLIGGPAQVHGYYYSSHNTFLTSLEGCAKVVDGYFITHSCPRLRTLYGLPHMFEIDNDLFENTAVPAIEREFAQKHISSNPLLKYINYHEDLFNYIVKEDVSKLADILWPEEFIKTKPGFEYLLKSADTIKKYML